MDPLLKLSRILKKIADQTDLSPFKFQQGQPLVFVGLPMAVLALIGPVDGRPVSLDDGPVHDEEEFRVAAKEEVEEFQDPVGAQEGLGLRKIERGVFVEQRPQALQVPVVEASKKFSAYFFGIHGDKTSLPRKGCNR
jgi:hypothetical protein